MRMALLMTNLQCAYDIVFLLTTASLTPSGFATLTQSKVREALFIAVILVLKVGRVSIGFGVLFFSVYKPVIHRISN